MGLWVGVRVILERRFSPENRKFGSSAAMAESCLTKNCLWFSVITLMWREGEEANGAEEAEEAMGLWLQ